MAGLPQDRRGQIFLALTVVALAALYFSWSGPPIGGLPGIKTLGDSALVLQARIDSLNQQVNTAKRTMTTGALPQLERALANYQSTLDLMRRLVPVSTEIPDLLDDIASRARIRGAEVINFVPSYPPESGSPFDTQRARFTVTGTYDQIGEFLADIASLPRIIVPYDLRLTRVANAPTVDTSQVHTDQLQANFSIRTYVKGTADTTGVPVAPPTPRPGAAPTRPGAPAPAARRSE